MTSVKLRAVSNPVGDLQGMTAEQFIAYCARVSNPSNQDNHESAQKLLKYLITHEHWSPFEMIHITMSIETTRDIARQILRHRSFSFQEFSQRYATSPGFVEQGRDARLQGATNRQSSEAVADEAVQAEWLRRQNKLTDAVVEHYSWALDQGIAREVARAILPEGLTLSRLYMSGTLRSWMHYCQLRTKPDTQLEHRDVAAAALDELRIRFPAVIAALQV